MTHAHPLHGKAILITGATGFLGGAIARRLSWLSAAGTQIRLLVRDPSRAAELRTLPNIEIMPGDLNNLRSLQQAVQGCDIVLHSAAALKGDLTTQMAVNRDGTRGLAEAAAAAGVQRFVHISTISVYGYRNRHDVTEDTPPNPGRDPYGVSKLAAELALRQVARERELPYTIMRPGMIYGVRSGMWTGQMYKLASRQPTLFIGTGSGSCYPIHVDDVVDFALLLATHPHAVGEVFNCTPDPSPTWRDFLGGYSRLAGHQSWLGIPPALLMPVAVLGGWFAPESSPLRDLPDLLPFSQRYITYRMAKAAHLLGWQPTVTLEDGIAGCAEWLREKQWKVKSGK